MLNSVTRGMLAALACPQYRPAPELWVITTYYNPMRYRTRRDNFDLFAASMRNAGLHLLVVECAFGDEDFELPEAADVIRVRSNSLLWQKERLLNLAASWLPSECKYVAWLDCDILFENPLWAVQTCELLKTHKVVQVFETALRFDKGNIVENMPDRVESFGFVTPGNEHLLSCGRYDSHGHTGYGWAMRRELFDEIGLYEYAIAGSADHYMAHAIYGTYGFCVDHSLRTNPLAGRHLREWGDRFYALVQGSFTVVPGEILHLWHGDLVNRRYLQRMLETNRLGFNPYEDVIARPGKPLEWNPSRNTQPLVDYFVEYFKNRREDG